MTIDEIELTEEESIELGKLKDDFKIRSKRSPAKKALGAREIKGYSLIFDEDNLTVSVQEEDDEPLKGYSVPEYCSIQIWLIREFWMRYIVEENDIAEIDKFEPGSWFWNLNDFAGKWLTEPRYYYSLAVIYCKYLDWLNPSKRAGITNSEFALIAFYRGEKISRGKIPTKPYLQFKYFEFEPNRIGASGSVIKNKNKMKLFENVIKQLTGDARKKAEKDLDELRRNIASDIYFDKDLKDIYK
jgi:hypothetical protein